MFDIKKNKIGIIGLGYVGLPLFMEFSKHTNVIGYDTDKSRIKDLKDCFDRNLEISSEELKTIDSIKFTSIVNDLEKCNIFIITVPTPIDENARPDLKHLISASEIVSNILKKNDIVIFESTVYPGATEEVCIPILEQQSTLKYNRDFYVGYSPERINPGDKTMKIGDIKKVVSGSNKKTSIHVKNLYDLIIREGTFLAKDIKTAEASKVIENIQRDVNIALVNELAIIFNKMNIDTLEVLDAAATKWNFIPFSPGLVGGHCIGVDPYYLKHKSELLGVYPKVISASRETNESMPAYIASKVLDNMIKNKINISSAKVLVLGLTFKENCPDIRNSKVFSLIENLKCLSLNVVAHDPYVDAKKIKKNFHLKVINNIHENKWDVIIIAVKHDQFVHMTHKDLNKILKKKSLVFDIKGARPKKESHQRL